MKDVPSHVLLCVVRLLRLPHQITSDFQSGMRMSQHRHHKVILPCNLLLELVSPFVRAERCAMMQLAAEWLTACLFADAAKGLCHTLSWLMGLQGV